MQVFEEMRDTQTVSVWPVGLVGGLMVEKPKIGESTGGTESGKKVFFDQGLIFLLLHLTRFSLISGSYWLGCFLVSPQAICGRYGRFCSQLKALPITAESKICLQGQERSSGVIFFQSIERQLL